MNGRNVITAIAVLACASAVCAVLIQRQRLTLLRAEQLQSPPTEHAPETTEAQAASGTQPNSQGDSSAELLRLRSQVTRLTARQRELAGVEAEAEHLREQLAAANSNAATGYKLPPGYIRKSQAQFVGYSSPENFRPKSSVPARHLKNSSKARKWSPAWPSKTGNRRRMGRSLSKCKSRR